jgi:hypothetical protein
MSGIDPTSLPNRRTIGPEAGVTKIARSEASHDEHSSPLQVSSWQSRSNAGGDPSTGRHSHSDPAVSLSASLARLDLGTTLKATVTGFDIAHQPIIKTDQGTFILDTGSITPPLDLKIDTQLELRIVAIDHVIEAQIVTKNNVSLSPPPLINLTLVGVDGGENEAAVFRQGGPLPGQPGTPPVQYAPQPAQTAMMSGMANLPPLPLPPTTFLNIREQGGNALQAALPAEDLQSFMAASSRPPGTSDKLASPPPALLSPGDQSAAQKAGNGPRVLAELATVLRPMSPLADPKPSTLTGLVAEATVVSAAKPGPTPAAGDTAAPRLTAGQTLLVKIVDVVFGEGNPAVPAKPFPPASPGQTLQTYSAAPMTNAPVLRMGGEVAIIETAGDMTATKTPPPEAAAETAGQGPDAPPPLKTLLVTTPAGVLRLQVPADLPLGHHLVIEVSQTAAEENPKTPPSAAARPEPPAQAELPLAGFLKKWPAIDNIIRALANIDPALAARLQARIAAPLNNLGGAILSLAKMQGHDGGVERWLGFEAAETLIRSGNQSLIAELKNDLSRLAQARSAAPGDWQTLLLPLHDGRETQALPVMIRSFESEARQDGGDGNKGKSGEKGGRVMRFVVDVSLSRLGGVQMDGMIRGKSFSLIMRTEQALGTTMRGKIRDIFGAALARNHFEGDLVFQPGSPFPLAASAFLTGSGNATGEHKGNSPGNIYV